MRRISLLIAAVLHVSLQATAIQLTQWAWLNPLPQGFRLAAVASSDGIVVAVGDQGTIAASEDGERWRVVHSQPRLTLNDVTWTGDVFVAVGGYYLPGLEGAAHPGVILKSIDGYRWTECTRVAYTMLLGVISTDEQILVVGYPGRVVTSPHGYHWQEHELSDFPDGEIVDVAWNGEVYVAVGAPNWFVGGKAIFVSEDGVSWAEASLEGLPAMGMLAVVWGHDQFLAFGGVWPGRPYVLASFDGQTWREVPTDLRGLITEAIAVPDGYLAVAEFGQVRSSADGTSWATVQVVPRSKRLLGIVSFKGDYVVVGDDGAIAISSDGGGEWDVKTSWEIDLGSGSLVDLRFANGFLVGGASDGRIFRSRDGLDWQEVEDFQSRLISVKWFDGNFWVVGSNSFIAASHDGGTWSKRSNAFGSDFSDIATNGNVIVAVGSRMLGQVSALVATSEDGFEWNEIDIEDSAGLRIASVAWSGSQFVGVASDGAVFRSDDGLQWSIGSIESSTHLERIVSNGSVLVAVGSARDTTLGRGVLVTSSDGVLWTTTFVEKTVHDVTWTGEAFVAVGGGWVHLSTDGRNWTTIPAGFAWYPERVLGIGTRILVTGDAGFVMEGKLLENSPRRAAGRIGDGR